MVPAFKPPLDVYAAINEELKERKIDGTGTVSTSLPMKLRSAISRNDRAAVEKEFQSWEPLIGLPFTRESGEAMIEDLGRSVGERVSQNCDISYSCSYPTWRNE